MGPRKRRPRQQPRQRPTTTPITFNKFPVILQDTGNGELKNHEWELATLLSSTVGEVNSIRPLTKNKIRTPYRVVIGCTTELQQQRLAKATQIGQASVSCSIPTPTVVGVIKGIPLDLSEQDIIDRSDPRITIKAATRLTLGSGAPSRAVKLNIQATHLPPTIQVAKMTLPVEPYIHRTIQCHNCLGLGHKTQECWRKDPNCATCGRRGHRRVNCTSDNYRCINCKGNHPATSPTCPAKSDHKMANKIMSSEYLPRTLALAKARKTRTDPPNPEQPPSTPAVPITPPEWQVESSPRPSYAEMTAGKANNPPNDNKPASSRAHSRRTPRPDLKKPSQNNNKSSLSNQDNCKSINGSQDDDKTSDSRQDKDGQDKGKHSHGSQDNNKSSPNCQDKTGKTANNKKKSQEANESASQNKDTREAIIEQIMTWTSNVIAEMKASTNRLIQEIKEANKQEINQLKKELQDIKVQLSNNKSQPSSQ